MVNLKILSNLIKTSSSSICLHTPGLTEHEASSCFGHHGSLDTLRKTGLLMHCQSFSMIHLARMSGTNILVRVPDTNLKLIRIPEQQHSLV